MGKKRSFVSEREFLRGVSNLLLCMGRRLLVVFCSARFLNDTDEPSQLLGFSPPIIVC